MASTMKHALHRETRMENAVDNSAFLTTVVSTIPGWLVDYTALRTMDILDWQEAHDIKGPLLEIGVFAGRYFSILLRSAVRTGDVIVGLDTFQFVNEPTVRSHLAKVAPDNAAKLICSTSTSVDASALEAILGAPARFISIDGSHERDDVLWDLQLAESLLAPGGIVAVDDYLNPLTLGVNEAVNVFFSQPHNLVPVAYIANKLFLTRPNDAKTVSSAIEDMIVSDATEPRSVDFRARSARGRHQAEVLVWGFPVLIAS